MKLICKRKLSEGLIVVVSVIAASIVRAEISVERQDTSVGSEKELSAQVMSVPKPLLHPNLSGIWKFDPAASDSADDLLKKSSGKRRPPPSFPGSGFPDRGGDIKRGRPGHPPPDMVEKDKIFDTQLPVVLLVDHLEIRHSDPEIVIISDDKDTLTAFTDYRGASISIHDDLDQKIVTAGWENGALVMEIRKQSGDLTVQTLRLREDPRRLERVIELSLSGPRTKPILIKQFFTPVSH